MDTNDLLSVLEMGTDSILVHDGSFPLFYNRRFLELFGYKTGSDYERCVQKNGLFKKFHHDDLKRVINSHDDRMAGNSRYTKYYSARIVRDPKDVRWIDLKISSIQWQGDHAVLVAIQDSTDAINRSKSNTHFQSLFTHVLSDTPAIITLTSIATGEYFHVSDMFETVLGYDKHWIIGRSSYELNIWVFEEERQHIADELAAGRNVVNYECSVYKRNGSIIPTTVWARVIRSEPEDMLLIVGFDRSAEVDRLQKIESLNHQLQLMATTDALTGCLNRGGIEEQLDVEMERLGRNGHGFSILFLDIDFFKRINDNYGHDVGDEVLKSVVAVVSQTIRTIDVLGRWGGEEFLLLLPSTDRESAITLAERIRHAVASMSFSVSQGGTIEVTVSIGVAEAAADQFTIDRLIKLADERLYRAKELGRNRVIASSENAVDSYKI